jgi:ubiquinone biosynthesis protein Coq4/drug/metabolite transporter (DMT)-like permease
MIPRSIHSIGPDRPLLPPPLRSAAIAAALMLLASALFALQAALVKTGLQQIAPLELVFFRGLICAALIFAFAKLGGQSLGTARPGGQFALGVIGFASLGLYFAALGMLPLVTATALNYTAPLFLAMVVGLRQARSVRAMLMLCVGGGFVGACLVLQPSLVGGNSTGVMLGLLSGTTAAGAYLLLSRLGRSGESERVTAFYFSLVVCLLAGIPTLVSGLSIATQEQIGLVLAIGVLATVGQLAMGRAYAVGPPLIPATFSYSTVIFSSVFGAFWWGEQLGFMETLGIALIVASGILVSASQARIHKPVPSAPPCGGDQGSTEKLVEKQRKRYYRKNTVRSLYAVFMLARNPERTNFVFMMGDAQDNIAESERARGGIADPFSSPELELMWQSRFRSQHYEVDDLLRLPAHTLGGAYARHMKLNGLRPDFYEDVAPRHRLHFLRLRMRQTHDIWHVLSGFGTDEFGEVGLQGFYFAQFTNGQSALIGAGAMLKSLLRGKFADLEKHVDAFCEGYCSGKRAESLLTAEWENLWAEDLESLRRRYRIELPRFRGADPAQRDLRAAA